MGSLVVKLDTPTVEKLKNRHHYSDVDVLGYRNRDAYGLDVPMEYDVEAVKISVRNILMWRVGESVLRPDFGHNIHRSMYEQMNEFNQDKVCEEIKRAIEDNEPRVSIKTVAVKRDDEDSDSSQTNVLHVRVIYTIVGNKTSDAEFTETTTIMGK